MSTRATIEFDNGFVKQYVYRQFDGDPDNVLPDLRKTISKIIQLIASHDIVDTILKYHLIMHNIPNEFNLTYRKVMGFHDFEDYRYFVKWNKRIKSWEISYQKHKGSYGDYWKGYRKVKVSE